ncbi:hypothetical protein PILCRDRAFT_15092 [Piloderma croceum F 1598]|uniref:Uncharacterized protein n=1 Tax=Piloderma croceum (strain F 1598) TaxID=765440 RepID=A0A0C3AIE0_PILCF|nr:hypothetical protein PILCRDRAFT_15092 [Piloderma croceum F 1598]
MFLALLLITVFTILVYLLLITQPTFHHRSYRYLRDEIRGYKYSFYFIILLLYFQFLSGFGNLIVLVDIQYFANNEAGYIKIGFRKHNDPETPILSTPPTRPATLSPPGTSEDPTRLQVPPELRHSHRRSIPILDDTTTSSYGVPIETSPLVEELRIVDQQLVEQSVFFDAEEPLPSVQCVSSLIPANRTETETPETLLDTSHSHLTSHLSVPSKNHFDLEPLEELMFATPLRMSANPHLPEHADIQSEDISLGHATLNLHHTLASLMDLYQPLRPLLGPLAQPTPSALFQIQTPVRFTAEQAIERSYQDSIDRLREPPRTHFCRGRYRISDDTDLNDSLEEERPFHSPEPLSIEEESPQEVPEELTSSTHPFYKGRQYPPVPPLEPPPQIHLPPPPALSTNPSMSNPPPAAPAAPTTPKERGRRPDPFSEPKNYKLFR